MSETLFAITIAYCSVTAVPKMHQVGPTMNFKDGPAYQREQESKESAVRRCIWAAEKCYQKNRSALDPAVNLYRYKCLK